jgi:hypothetical protein
MTEDAGGRHAGIENGKAIGTLGSGKLAVEAPADRVDDVGQRGREVHHADCLGGKLASDGQVEENAAPGPQQL